MKRDEERLFVPRLRIFLEFMSSGGKGGSLAILSFSLCHLNQSIASRPSSFALFHVWRRSFGRSVFGTRQQTLHTRDVVAPGCKLVDASLWIFDVCTPSLLIGPLFYIYLIVRLCYDVKMCSRRVVSVSTSRIANSGSSDRLHNTLHSTSNSATCAPRLELGTQNTQP